MALLLLVLLLVCVEIGFRLTVGAPKRSQPFVPYLMYGNFEKATAADMEHGAEGPEASGYERHWGVFLPSHSKNPPVTSLTRSNYLFNNYLSRYSAADVDKIARENKDAIRIMVIGGSVAVGSSATTKTAVWHTQLEKRLREQFPGKAVYVFNAAMGGFNSTQERLSFDLAVSPRHPDAVIDLNGFNDVSAGITGRCVPGDPSQMGAFYEREYDTSLSRWLFENSSAMNFAMSGHIRSLQIERAAEIAGDDRMGQRVLQGCVNVYVDNMKHLYRRCKQDDIECLVVLQCFRDLTDKRAGKPASPSSDLLARSYEQIVQRFQEEIAERRFADMSDLMKGAEAHYTDKVHIDDEGQKMMAEFILPYAREAVERALAKREIQPAAPKP